MTGAAHNDITEYIADAVARGQPFIDIPWEDETVQWLVEHGFEIASIDCEFIKVRWGDAY